MAVKTYENFNIIEAAKQAGFGMLLKAAEKAGLLDYLETAEDITIFAPDDEAFNAIEKTVLEGLMMVQNQDKLADILKYHIISSKMPSEAVESLDDIEMMNGQKVEIFKRNGDLLVNEAKIIQPDIHTKNAIIHSIDKVLMPE